MDRILPRPTPTSQPYFDGCKQGELRLQRCSRCGNYQFYPRILCSHCGAPEPAWEAVSGEGVIASFSVVRRGLTPAYEAPYVVALVDLAEGPRMMSMIVDVDPDTVAVGAAVSVEFQAWSEEVSLPVFRLKEE